MAIKNNKPVFETSIERHQPKTRSDLLKVLSTMEKALCRQHIMWPIEGELPCEKAQSCSKSNLCRQMAEEVMDFSRMLDSASES